jgi:hypothetical protein
VKNEKAKGKGKSERRKRKDEGKADSTGRHEQLRDYQRIAAGNQQ